MREGRGPILYPINLIKQLCLYLESLMLMLKTHTPMQQQEVYWTEEEVYMLFLPIPRRDMNW